MSISARHSRVKKLATSLGSKSFWLSLNSLKLLVKTVLFQNGTFSYCKNITFQTRKKQLHIFQQFEGRYFVDTKDHLLENDHQIYLNFKPMVLTCRKLTGQYLKHLLYIIEFCLKTVSTYPQTVKKHVHVCPGSLCSQGRINADFNFSAVCFLLFDGLWQHRLSSFKGRDKE